jgi:hypothetical protein
MMAVRCRLASRGRAAQGHAVLVVLGDDAVVVGELAFDQLGHELHAAKGELGLVVGELHFDVRLVLATRIRQQALQLDHGLARQDDFLLGHFHIQRGAGKGQAVAVGGDQAQGLALGHKQNAVEVVADVLHCHGKRHLAQQVLQRLLWHGKHGAEGGRFLHQREVFSRQALQREAALAALQDQLGLLDSRLTVWSPGMVFKMSMSLRAPTVVVKSPVSPPSSAVVRIWISRSLVVSCSALPVLRISTLARMGSVCRRSTMPATDWSTARTLSCVAFRTIMSSTSCGF